MYIFVLDHCDKGQTTSQANRYALSHDTSDYAESSMADEVHRVQEDRARSFLQDFIHGKNAQASSIVNKLVVQKQNVSNKADGMEPKVNPTSQISSHFEELKIKQKEEQKHFNQKLMQELSTSVSKIKTAPSFVNTGRPLKLIIERQKLV